jgi:hypothetical protein
VPPDRAARPAGRPRHQARGWPRDPRAQPARHPFPWLFPGHRPGSALTEDALAQRLHAIGISPRQGRSTALFAPAAEVPAAILAKTLGIHVQVAIQWQKISPGDWTSYAADVSRRTARSPGLCPKLPECRGLSCWAGTGKWAPPPR